MTISHTNMHDMITHIGTNSNVHMLLIRKHGSSSYTYVSPTATIHKILLYHNDKCYTFLSETDTKETINLKEMKTNRIKTRIKVTKYVPL